MNWHASIRVRLASLSLALFLALAVAAILTLRTFGQFNEMSDALRKQWLPATRILGDLNNSTSDVRTAEADVLLASGDAERALRIAELDRLNADVTKSQAAYMAIRRGGEERALYARFAEQWATYGQRVGQVVALARAGRVPEAVALYRTRTRSANDAASNTLGALTALTMDLAGAASIRIQNEYANGRSLIAAMLLVVVMLFVGSLAFIKRWISTPLADMAELMRQLAANNTCITVPGLNRRDEIGQMAQALTVFRANAIALIRSQQALAAQAALLEENLANERQLTQLQRNFIEMTSHEFRTPLTVIDAHAQRLLKGKGHADLPDVEERANRIRRTVHRMTAIMESLLASSRLIEGSAASTFRPADLDIAALLRDVVSYYKDCAPAAQFFEHALDAPFILQGDRNLLFIAFSNLISNAIKYSPDGAAITLALARTSSGAAVRISDNGIGIPAHDVEGLFTRYHRGSNVAGIVGTGVGLHIVKNIVTLHGGTIAVQPDRARGSCFIVTLPVAPAARCSEPMALDSTHQALFSG